MKPFLYLSTFLIFLVFADSYYIGNNGCHDMLRIPIASSINLPDKYSSKFNRPWLIPKLKTRIYSSQTLAQNWRWFKSQKIQGINSTFAEILQIFEKNDCFFVGYSSGIKDILLGKIKEESLLKIDGETSCDSLKLYQICSNNFGLDNCGAAPNTPNDKIVLGNSRTSKELNEILIEPISIFSWNSMITMDRLKWDFTVNECTLLDDFSGNVYFIDYTAQSQMDICQNSIKIPVQPKFWKKWTQNNLLKILNVYNLVSDGFAVEEREYQFFIDFIKDNFNTANFQEYFCSILYGGKFYPWISQTNTTKSQIQNRSQCHFLTLDSRRNRLIKKVNQTLEEDFGEFWRQNMTDALIGMLLFEDKGKPQNSFMKKLITLNHQNDENNYKNGQSRTRDVLTENDRFVPFSSSTSEIVYPQSGTLTAAKTVEVTLKVNCDQNVVSIDGQNSAANFPISSNPQPLTVSNDNHHSPSNSIKTDVPKATNNINISNSRVLASNVPYIPSPPKPEKLTQEQKSKIWHLWNSGTPSPGVKYYSRDETPKVLATDY